MPQKVGSPITNLDDIPEIEFKHIPINCLWTITSEDTSLTVIITCLKWTFNFDLCVRVTAYPLGSPNASKQMDLDDHHPLLRSLTDALNLYEAFPEPHLNPCQIEILEELMEYLHFKFYWSIIAAQPHLAYPDLALDKFSGTDPDQYAEAFTRLIECKFNFALRTEPEPGELAHAIYLFKKKALFSSLLRRPAAEWYGSTIQDAMTWNEVRTLLSTRFLHGRNKFNTEWKMSILYEPMEKKFETSFTEQRR